MEVGETKKDNKKKRIKNHRSLVGILERYQVENRREGILKEVCVCVCVCVLAPQSCPALCDSLDCRLPGPSVHEILQARILE